MTAEAYRGSVALLDYARDHVGIWIPDTDERIEVAYPRWWRHYLGAACMLTVLLSMFGIIRWLWPWSGNSIISLIFGGGSNGPGGGIPSWIYFPLFALLTIPLLRPKLIWKYARREEVEYRQGSEFWPLRKRLWVCLRFGLAHFWNLIIPLALALAITTGGLYLMWVYRRSYKRSARVTGLAAPSLHQNYALECSTRAHVAWNRFALGFMATVLALSYATG